MLSGKLIHPPHQSGRDYRSVYAHGRQLHALTVDDFVTVLFLRTALGCGSNVFQNGDRIHDRVPQGGRKRSGRSSKTWIPMDYAKAPALPLGNLSAMLGLSFARQKNTSASFN
jgi:hypothetical protein